MTDMSITRRIGLEEATPVAPPAGADWAATAGASARFMLPRIRVDAFLADDADAAAVKELASDRRAARASFRITEGGFDTAIERTRAAPGADILIVEHLGDADELPSLVESLAEHCSYRTRLVVLGESNDVALYRNLLMRGVAEYLVRPLTIPTLLEALVSVLEETEEAERLGSVIAFVGARGGVGASTVAQNAAAALNRLSGGASILIDADIGFGSAAMLFDAEAPHTFADAARERGNLTVGVLEKLIHWPKKNFGLLAAPVRPDLIAAPDPGRMQHVVELARRLGRHVVVDLPTGLAPWSSEVFEVADEVAVVATLDLPSLRNTRTLIDILRRDRMHDRPPRVILNRVKARGQTMPRAEFERVLGAQIAAEIPETAAAEVAEFEGRTLHEAEPRGGATAAIDALSVILGDLPAQPQAKRKGLFDALRRRR